MLVLVSSRIGDLYQKVGSVTDSTQKALMIMDRHRKEQGSTGNTGNTGNTGKHRKA